MSRNRFSLSAGIVFVSALACATAAMADVPMVYSAWKKTTVTQDVCLQHAETDLRKNGYTGIATGAKGTSTTYTGFSGDYTGLVRCAADSLGAVFFVVAGPSPDVANNLVNGLLNAF